MVNAVTIYVEGGGDSKELRARCREGFAKLVQHAGYTSRRPRFVACGGRDAAFKAFRTALAHPQRERMVMMLVDSEDPVQPPIDTDPDSPHAWEHVRWRDHWYKPKQATNDQAQLMATCTEAWIIADPDGLARFYDDDFNFDALRSPVPIEDRDRHELFHTLVEATAKCSRHYSKRGAFKVLAAIDPKVLYEELPHFRRFMATLERYLH